jgi:hypothetical protein
MGFTIYGAALIVFWFLINAFRNTSGMVRRNLGRSMLGAFLLGTGIGCSADLMVQTYGRFLVSTGLLVQLAGTIIVMASFYAIRTTDEFRWTEEASSLFIIFNSLCIYTYSLEKNMVLKEADLHGGGLASVLIVAQSIVKSDEPPEHIEYQDLHFLVKVSEEQFGSEKVIFVLIVKKDLSILREKLDEYLRKFINRFKETLSTWKGNVAVFKEKGEDLVQVFKNVKKAKKSEISKMSTS